MYIYLYICICINVYIYTHIHTHVIYSYMYISTLKPLIKSPSPEGSPGDVGLGPYPLGALLSHKMYELSGFSVLNPTQICRLVLLSSESKQ